MRILWNNLKRKYDKTAKPNKGSEYFELKKINDIKIGLLYRDDNVYIMIQAANKNNLKGINTLGLEPNKNNLTRRISNNFEAAHTPVAVNDLKAWSQVDIKYIVNNKKNIETMLEEIDMGINTLIDEISHII